MDWEGAGRGGALFFSGTFFSASGGHDLLQSTLQKKDPMGNGETPVETLQD